MKEVNTIDVVLMIDKNINIVSFEETLEGNDAAEALFEKLFINIIKNDIDDEDDYKDNPDFQNIEDYVMDGYYCGSSGEELYIIHSKFKIVED